MLMRNTNATRTFFKEVRVLAENHVAMDEVRFQVEAGIAVEGVLWPDTISTVHT